MLIDAKSIIPEGKEEEIILGRARLRLATTHRMEGVLE